MQEARLILPRDLGLVHILRKDGLIVRGLLVRVRVRVRLRVRVRARVRVRVSVGARARARIRVRVSLTCSASSSSSDSSCQKARASTDPGATGSAASPPAGSKRPHSCAIG